MIHQKALNQGPFDDEPTRSWGTLTRYTEIGDDLYAMRHVDFYANGHTLRYDRSHWVDGFGMLADMRFDEKKWKEWWGRVIAIDPTEFEDVWQSAPSSPTWSEQVGSARMADFGAVPIWLNLRPGRA